MTSKLDSVGLRVQFAIETECSARKAGNVHPQASFENLNHRHFVVAAKAIGERIDHCIGQPVGQIVLHSVRAMMDAVGTNTSLGTILLMAPLAAATHRSFEKNHKNESLHDYLNETLSTLTQDDSRDIYEAIRIAKPGGLGDSQSMDVRELAPKNVLDAMRLASAWDDIALQYVSDFALVFEIWRRIKIKQAIGLAKLDAIRCVQMEVLSERVDSLITRKQGLVFAKQVQSLAGEVLSSGPYGSEEYEASWQSIDAYMRDAEHRGNPGTIADLIAAALF